MLSESLSEDFGYKLETTVSVFPDGVPLEALALEPLSLLSIAHENELIAVSDSKKIKLGSLSDLNHLAEAPVAFAGPITQIGFSSDELRLYVLAGSTLSYVSTEDQTVHSLFNDVSSFKLKSKDILYLSKSGQLYLSTGDVASLIDENVSSYSINAYTQKDSHNINLYNGSIITVGLDAEALEEADIDDFSQYSPIHISPCGSSWFVVYESSDSELDSPVVRAFIIDPKGKSSFTYVADPFSSVERSIVYYTESLKKWSDAETSHYFITSGLASEWSAIQSHTSDPEVASVVPAEDSSKSTFPLEENGDDLSVVGTALDLSSDVEVKEPCPGVDSYKSLPRLLTLLHSGDLLSWWIVEKKAFINNTADTARASAAVDEIDTAAAAEAIQIPQSPIIPTETLGKSSFKLDDLSSQIGGLLNPTSSDSPTPVNSSTSSSSFASKPSGLAASPFATKLDENPFATSKSPFSSTAAATESPFSSLSGSGAFGNLKAAPAPEKKPTPFGSSGPTFGGSAFGSKPETSFGSTSFGKPASSFGSTSFGSQTKTAFGSTGFGSSGKSDEPKVVSSFGSFATGKASVFGSKESSLGQKDIFGKESAPSIFGDKPKDPLQSSPFAGFGKPQAKEAETAIPAAPFGTPLKTAQPETKPAEPKKFGGSFVKVAGDKLPPFFSNPVVVEPEETDNSSEQEEVFQRTKSPLKESFFGSANSSSKAPVFNQSSSFGQTSSSTFSQSSTFGQTKQSAFTESSTFGQTKQSMFTQSSQTTQTLNQTKVPILKTQDTQAEAAKEPSLQESPLKAVPNLPETPENELDTTSGSYSDTGSEDWSEIDAPSEEEEDNLQVESLPVDSLSVDEYEVGVLQKNCLPVQEDFLKYDGLTIKGEMTKDPIMDKIYSIYQETSGLIKVLEKNINTLNRVVDAHEVVDETQYTSPDTLKYPEKWRLSSLEDLAFFIDDLIPAVQYGLDVTTKQDSQLVESAELLQKTKDARIHIDRLLSQIEIYKNYSKSTHLKNRSLDVPTENTQRRLRLKLESVKQKQKQLVSLMLPLKCKVSCSEDTLKGLENAVYQVNARVQQVVGSVDETAKEVQSVNNLQLPRIASSSPEPLVEKTNVKWNIGKKDRNVKPRAIVF